MVEEDYPKTYQEFLHRFQCEGDCIDYLYQIRRPEGFICPRCRSRTAWKTSRSLMHCSDCGHQTSITAGTVFQDTRKPLRLFEKALKEARILVQQAPQLPQANFEVGFQLKNFGRFEKSKPFFERAVALDPNHSESYNALGELLLRDGKEEEAIPRFLKAIDNNPKYIEAYLAWAKHSSP